MVCHLTVVLPQIFFNLNTLFSYPVCLCLLHAPLDVVVHFPLFLRSFMYESLLSQFLYNGWKRSVSPSGERNSYLLDNILSKSYRTACYMFTTNKSPPPPPPQQEKKKKKTYNNTTTESPIPPHSHSRSPDELQGLKRWSLVWCGSRLAHWWRRHSSIGWCNNSESWGTVWRPSVMSALYHTLRGGDTINAEWGNISTTEYQFAISGDKSIYQVIHVCTN